MKKLIALYANAQTFMQSKAKDEKGATMVEYGLMVALIAVIVMAAVGPLGVATAGMFNGVVAAL